MDYWTISPLFLKVGTGGSLAKATLHIGIYLASMVFRCSLGQLLYLLSIYLTFSMDLHATKSHKTKPKGQLNRLPWKQDEGILSTDIQQGAARTKSLPLGNQCVSGETNSWEWNIANTNKGNEERKGRVTAASLNIASAPAHCLK